MSEPVIDETMGGEILPKGTTPLPYVQCGMVIKENKNDDTWWIVKSIEGQGKELEIGLEHVGPAHIDVAAYRIESNKFVRKNYTLMQDFDPSATPWEND